MARMPRAYFEVCAQHIIQRGNNRAVCFFSEADYGFYCQKLKTSAFWSVANKAFYGVFANVGGLKHCATSKACGSCDCAQDDESGARNDVSGALDACSFSVTLRAVAGSIL
jgi:hypothetical protein